MPVLVAAVIFVVAFVLWVMLTSSPLRQMNVGARLFREKRYAEAERHFLRLLTHRLPPAIEADTRRRLADTLDVLGKPEAAAAERARAGQAAIGGGRDPMALTTQGDLFKRQKRYDEACEVYQNALNLTPNVASSGQALIMAKLTSAHYEAGRPGDALKWAMASLQNNPEKDLRRSMESMAGVASSDLGDLEGAEGHYVRALELAEACGTPEEVARTLAILGGVQHKRGQFLEAIASCRRARQRSAGGPLPTAVMVEADCLRDMGRFDEARAVMAEGRQAPGYDQPWLERRMQATSALGAAGIEVRADQPEAALAFLERAREGFRATSGAEDGMVWPPSPQGADDKLLLWCDATEVLALAQRGDVRASRRMREDVLDRLPRFAQDRSTKMGMYSNLGRAAFICGDLAECQELLHQYLECKPYPVGLLSAHYWLGETALRLGETKQARNCFEQAVAPGIDSLDARRAQARLDEMGA